jgi:hypothetical protein
MSTITYTSVFGDVAANVSGVPDFVLASYMNKVTIDLCERAKVWRVAYAPVTLVSGQVAYTLVSPTPQTELSAVLTSKVYLGSTARWKSLDIVTTEQIFKVYPDWPDTTEIKEPTAVTRLDEAAIAVVPNPDAAQTYSLYLYCAIRPTLTATGLDSTIYATYRRTIYHGVLHELMMMPKRPWTDEKRAAYHGKQWEYMVANARARANKSFGRANINVVPAPWA